MVKPLDPNKPIRRRDGAERGKEWDAMQGPDGRWYGWRLMGGMSSVCLWEPDGSWRGEPSSLDLLQEPVIEERWLNFYPKMSGHPTHDAANQNAFDTRIALLHIWREDGGPWQVEVVKP